MGEKLSLSGMGEKGTGIQQLAWKEKIPHENQCFAASHHPSTALPPSEHCETPGRVRVQVTGDVSTIVYLKREHSPGERHLPLPFGSLAVQNSPIGSKGLAPNTGHPKACLPPVHNTLPPLRAKENHSIPLGKLEGKTQDMREPSQKPFPRYQSSQHEIQAGCEASLHRPLYALLHGGAWLHTSTFAEPRSCRERGLAVRSPTLPCLPFRSDPKTCIPHINQQLAQFVTI